MRRDLDTKVLLCEVFELQGGDYDLPDISQDTILNILKEFSEKETAAILYRFVDRLTYSQIGLRLGVTRQRVCQILCNAKKKLRHQLTLLGDVREIDSDNISSLGLTIRSKNALKNAGINKISELNKMSDGKLSLISNMGIKLLSEIRDSLLIYRISK
jgi:predicted DNA-binding protein (UPF0251 family)